MRWELEEIARGALEQTDLGPPVDPDILAHRLQLEVMDGGAGCEGLLIGRWIFVDEAMRPERRAFAIAHEIGHHLLRRHGLEVPGRNDERGADYLASALLLPRDDFERDLRRLGWDLIALHARHRHASFEAIARRIVALRDARAFVFDRPLRGQAHPSSYSVPWGLVPTDDELAGVEAAIADGGPVEVTCGLTAWPVIQHDWVRVITVGPE